MLISGSCLRGIWPEILLLLQLKAIQMDQEGAEDGGSFFGLQLLLLLLGKQYQGWIMYDTFKASTELSGYSH